MSDKIPALSASVVPPLVRGMASIATELGRGVAVGDIAAQLGGPFASEADIVGASFDTAMLALLSNQAGLGLALLHDVLFQSRLFRVIPSLPMAGGGTRRLRVLALMAEGGLQNNLPIEFITTHLPVQLDLLFVAAGEDLPDLLPEHDLAMCLVGDQRRDILRQLVSQLANWPRPVLNHPAQTLGGHVELLSRDGMARLFAGSGTVLVPPARNFARDDIGGMKDFGVGEGWPILARPEFSHAGHLLELLHGPDELAVYVDCVSAARFTLTRFVDYRNQDGLFRKQRIALIDGEPFLCHMAISSDWMIHYANVGMHLSPDKRAEEAAAMEAFDTGFALRHRDGLAEISAALGLDYVLIDCAEAPDGRLLLFEVEMAAIVHALDPVEVFGYKQPQMKRVFQAFHRMLEDAIVVGAQEE